MKLHRQKRFEVIIAYGTNRTGLAALLLKWITSAKLIVEIPGVPEDAYRYDKPRQTGLGVSLKRVMHLIPLSPTFLVVGAMLAWSIIRLIKSGPSDKPKTYQFIENLLELRPVRAFLLLGACFIVSFVFVAGYINPRDYVQDVVAAHQFLRHSTMYPDTLPEMGITELSAPIHGGDQLRRLPIIRHEFDTLEDPPAPANAHPPLVGIILTLPVLLFGLRGSFAFVFLLSAFLLFWSEMIIIRELFPSWSPTKRQAVTALIWGWYPVVASLRSAQPSILILFLMTASWSLVRRNRPWLAGTAAGLAASLHAFPALVLVYFAIRCRRAFVSMISTIIVLGIAVLVVSPKHTFTEWINTAGTISSRFVPKIDNLSLAGVFCRLLRGLGWDGNIHFIMTAVLLTLTAALVLFLRPWRRIENRPERVDLEYAVFLTGMLLASPIAWIRYLPLMLLPFAVVIRTWKQPSGWTAPAFLATILLASIPESTFDSMHSWVAWHFGFPASWLETVLPSLCILMVLLYLISSASLLEERTHVNITDCDSGL